MTAEAAVDIEDSIKRKRFYISLKTCLRLLTSGMLWALKHMVFVLQRILLLSITIPDGVENWNSRCWWIRSRTLILIMKNLSRKYCVRLSTSCIKKWSDSPPFSEIVDAACSFSSIIPRAIVSTTAMCRRWTWSRQLVNLHRHKSYHMKQKLF